jgi:phosphoglycerol transferase MdoB-like AlkP superfamily enzyme
MRSYKLVLHKYKVPLAIVILVAGVVLMAVSFISFPRNGQTQKSAPLGDLRGINAILFIFSIVPVLVGTYYLYDYAVCKRKFESLMKSNSEAIFKRNQIELERLALRLSTNEEARVLETMKRYRIR